MSEMSENKRKAQAQKAKGAALIGTGVTAVAMGATGGLAAIPALVGVFLFATADRNHTVD